MSTCISRAGEYSDHETTEGNYICDRCGLLDEDGIFAELDRLRATVARVDALVEQWDGATEANEDAYPVQARVMQINIAELRAALDGDA